MSEMHSTLYKIVDIDTGRKRGQLEECGVYSEREIHRILQSHLYIQYLKDKEEIKEELKNSSCMNDERRCMYMDFIEEPFYPLSLREMWNKYYISQKMKLCRRSHQHGLFCLWKTNIEYIFTDVENRIT